MSSSSSEAAEAAALRAENAKLVAEMASMKKKIMVAFKKQQTELQSKLKAAEQRAEAAEKVADSDEARKMLQEEVENLRSQLQEERCSNQTLQDQASEHKAKVEQEIQDLKVFIEGQARQGQESKEKLEAELSRVKLDASEELQNATKVNENLENQLLSAVEQVKEAFARVALAHDNLETVRRESLEAKRGHAELLSEHERTCKEVEQLKTTLMKLQNNDENVKPQQSDMEHLLQEKAELAGSLKEKDEALFDLQRQILKLQAGTEVGVHDDDNQSLALISELKKENEVLRTQLEEFENKSGEDSTESVEKWQSLVPLENQEELEDLKKQLQEVRVAHAEAEQKVDMLTQELSEVRKKMEEEIKSRDDRYAELDSRLGKLLKRAKQRIQDLQKEKEEVETQIAAMAGKFEEVSSQNSTLQSDLERLRNQAGEALRSLDGERQQLRTLNSKQRELLEELRQTVEAKEKDLTEANHLRLEKEQLAQELTEKIGQIELKHENLLSELASKHRKVVDNLQAQVADAVQERAKIASTVSSLQVQLAKKEAEFIEIDAASSGELARLRALLEAAKGDLARVEQEHRKEHADLEAGIDDLKKKLEESEKARLQEDIAAAKARSILESELEGQRQALFACQADLASSKEQVVRLENEFASYKVRAHSLLQRKEAEILAVKDVERLTEVEAALKEAQIEMASVMRERDRALKSLQDATLEHQNELISRVAMLTDAEKKILDLASQLRSMQTQLQSKEALWQRQFKDMDLKWRSKCEALESTRKDSNEDNEKLASLQKEFDILKGEYASFQEMANNMLEAKDQEISRLLDEINRTQYLMQQHEKITGEVARKEYEADDTPISSIAIAEQQILTLARQQAQREEEVAQCHRHIKALQEEIAELERENRLHGQQEALLKEELRSMERTRKRDGVDLTYLKNVIVKLLETAEVEALLPVIAMLLQFSPEELRKCQEAYNSASTDVPLSSAAAVVDAAASAPRSLLSRLAFSKSVR